MQATLIGLLGDAFRPKRKDRPEFIGEAVVIDTSDISGLYLHMEPTCTLFPCCSTCNVENCDFGRETRYCTLPGETRGHKERSP